MDKNEIRSRIRKKLYSQSRDEIKEKSSKIMNNLLKVPEFKKAKTVALYLAKPYEVDTNYTIRHLIGKKEISVPVTNKKIKLVEFTSFEDLIQGKFEVYEPKKKVPINYDPEVVVVPGIAFDVSKNRLGHGKGFYDIFLSNKNVYKIGIAFDFQIIDKIPSKPHDIGMDMVITEKRII